MTVIAVMDHPANGARLTDTQRAGLASKVEAARRTGPEETSNRALFICGWCSGLRKGASRTIRVRSSH